MRVVKIIAGSAAVALGLVVAIYAGIWVAEAVLRSHHFLVDVIATEPVLGFIVDNPIWIIAAVAFVWLVFTQLCGLPWEMSATVTFIVTFLTSIALSWAIDDLRLGWVQASEVVNFYLRIVEIAWVIGLWLVFIFWSVNKISVKAAQEETATAGEEE